MRKAKTIEEAITHLEPTFKKMCVVFGYDYSAIGYCVAFAMRDHDLVEGPADIYKSFCAVWGSAKEAIK